MEKQLVSQQRRVGTRCLMYSLPETPHYARSDSHVRVPRIMPFVSSYYTMPTYGPLCSRCFIVECSCCVISDALPLPRLIIAYAGLARVRH